LSLGLPNHFEECDGHKASGRGYQWIAGLIPIRIVFAADDMEEITFVKGKLLCFFRLRFIVVKRLDDLRLTSQ
jgi:hypothetical protein